MTPLFQPLYPKDQVQVRSRGFPFRPMLSRPSHAALLSAICVSPAEGLSDLTLTPLCPELSTFCSPWAGKLSTSIPTPIRMKSSKRLPSQGCLVPACLSIPPLTIPGLATIPENSVPWTHQIHCFSTWCFCFHCFTHSSEQTPFPFLHLVNSFPHFDVAPLLPSYPLWGS